MKATTSYTETNPSTGLRPSSGLNVFVLGATGTAGRATVNALLRGGHSVTCLVRSNESDQAAEDIRRCTQLPEAVDLRIGDVANAESLREDGFRADQFDVLVSCLASRTGSAEDAWAIDYRAHSQALAIAIEAGIQHMVLLSAICVQKPLLAFQHAKLAFEQELSNSAITYSIVRPTAFFKSLSGQVERVRSGKSFLIFGDGRLTACKPISDRDLGEFMASCLTDKTKHNKILPIGGPGPAITPREQGEWLFQLTGKKPKFQQVPIGFLVGIQKILLLLGHVSHVCAKKAELAKIGHYYATESMLVLNETTGQYDANATPSFGNETLRNFYASVLDGTASIDLGEHTVFGDKK